MRNKKTWTAALEDVPPSVPEGYKMSQPTSDKTLFILVDGLIIYL